MNILWVLRNVKLFIFIVLDIFNTLSLRYTPRIEPGENSDRAGVYYP